MKKLLAFLFAMVMLMAFTACTVEEQPGDKKEDVTTEDSAEKETNPENTKAETTEPETTAEEKKELSFGSTFTFDDLEITIGNAENITWAKIENQYSDKNGADVIVLPVTVKNLKDETHSLNMFYYSFYGSAETELGSVSSYFSDTDIGFAGDMRSGASMTSAFHILYDGDGDYYIEFSQFYPTEKIEVKLPITK